jgi:ATP-binding protein involved in chromosome partitioning
MDDRLRGALSAVIEKQSERDIIAAGRVDSAAIQGDAATIILTPPVAGKADLDVLKPQIEEAVEALDGVGRARVIMTAHSDKPAPRQERRRPEPKPAPAGEKPAARIIAVASGKGGVGKSTVAANIAAALAADGLRVGLLDADIYGPSAPRIFGLVDVPGLRKSDDGVEPLEAYGVKLVSMGFVVKPGAPVVWRGPMVQGAIRQFLTETNWSGGGAPLDVLVIDMPPGTGDAQLALAQDLPVDGAVIVSTPQDLALDDARKAMALFEQTHIPILGLIENMSVFLCPHCGETSEIFGHGGARAEAEAIGAPFLGEIPLTMALREASDAGRPAALADDPVARAFLKAGRAALDAADATRKPAPQIVFD